MMNILDICSNIKEYYHLSENNFDKENVVSMVFYYFCKGLIEKRNELIIKKLLAVCELKEEPENKIFDANKKYINPFTITEEHGLKGIKSKISGLFLETKTPKDSQYNIAFTKKTIETLEILHFALSNHFPIILEGLNGQGKQTCINYLADMLDFKVENLIISPDKKVEDSLGHTIITKDNLGNLKIIFNETQLAKELKYGNQGKKPTLFVVHNINNASPAILDLLNTIFDKDQESILFPDNNLIKKCTINIICIFNPIKGATRDNKLPQNMIFNSIYYIVQDPFLNDVNEIIFKKLQYEEFKEDYKKLYENYKKTKILIEKRFQKDNTLNLNDISKYIELRKVSYKSLEVCLSIDKIGFMTEDAFRLVNFCKHSGLVTSFPLSSLSISVITTVLHLKIFTE